MNNVCGPGTDQSRHAAGAMIRWFQRGPYQVSCIQPEYPRHSHMVKPLSPLAHPGLSLRRPIGHHEHWAV